MRATEPRPSRSWTARRMPGSIFAFSFRSFGAASIDARCLLFRRATRWYTISERIRARAQRGVLRKSEGFSNDQILERAVAGMATNQYALAPLGARPRLHHKHPLRRLMCAAQSRADRRRGGR